MSSSHPYPTATPATRRALIGGAALMASFAGVRSLAAAQAVAGAPGRPGTGSRTSLHQDVAFSAPPAKLYDALLSSKAFTAFSGVPATIDPKPGGAFSLFGGQIVGRNIELVRDRRIVQAWRAIEDFPSGVYSLVKFELEPKGGGTTLRLDQTGFPPGRFDHLNAGWESHYWTPFRKFLA